LMSKELLRNPAQKHKPGILFKIVNYLKNK
jgi:hypothetical protein